MAKAEAKRGEPAVFNASVVVALVVGGALLLLAALWGLTNSGLLNRAREGGATSFSYSALGLRLSYDLFEQLDMPVLRYYYTTEADLWGSVVVIAAPPREEFLKKAREAFADASVILVALPKRYEPPFSRIGRFARNVTLGSEARPNAVLEHIAPGARVVRGDELGPFVSNEFGVRPALSAPQLIQGGALSPVVGTADGALVAAVPRTFLDGPGPDVWILSDVDLLSNHAIDDGDNAVFVARLLGQLRRDFAPIVFDETSGLTAEPPSFYRAFFTPPFVSVTASVVALFAVIGLIALGGFGARRTAPPGLRAGKETLLEATALLLRRGQGEAGTLRRFFNETLRDVAMRAHAPTLKTDEELVRWLASLEQTRRRRAGAAAGETAAATVSASPGVEALARQVELMSRRARPNPQRIAAVAREINAWRREMLFGRE